MQRRSPQRLHFARRSNTAAACTRRRLLRVAEAGFAKTNQPFAIAMKDGQPYALAGLWERWKYRKAGGEPLTFTVFTTDPNEVVQALHDRMPVIIPERDYERPPIDLLRPYDAVKMTAWKVDKAVGNVKNDSPDLIERASTTPKESPRSLFP